MIGTRPTILRYLLRKGIKDLDRGNNIEILKRVNLVRRFFTYIMQYEIEFKLEAYRRHAFEKEEDSVWTKEKLMREFGVEKSIDIPGTIFKQEDFDDLFRYCEDPFEAYKEGVGGSLEDVVKEIEARIEAAGEKGGADRTLKVRNYNAGEENASKYFREGSPSHELTKYLQNIGKNLKIEVNKSIEHNEKYLTKFKNGWGAFIKDVLTPYIYVLALPLYKVFGRFIKDKDNSRIARFFAEDAREKASQGIVGFKTKKGKRFFIQSLTIGLAYSAFVLYIATKFALAWTVATASPIFLLAIVVGIIFFPLGYLSVKEFGVMFISWLKMKREHIAVLRTIINPWPEGKIRKLMDGMFIDKDRNDLRIDNITGKSSVDIWNDNIEHLFKEGFIREDERDAYIIEGRTVEDVRR